VNDENGCYMVSRPYDRNSFASIPRSARVFVDGGCLIVYDKYDNILCAFAAGEWAEVQDVELYPYETPGD